MAVEVRQMKWWGWGEEGTGFDISNKPDLWPFIRSAAGLEEEPEPSPPVSMEEVQLPEQKTHEAFVSAVSSTLEAGQLRQDREERLVHAYGKSFRDLWRARTGIIDAAPDYVIYPNSEADVSAVIKAAVTHDVVVIPYGGGSNIAGCLEAKGNGGRTVISLDMKRMDRVLEIDEEAHIARIQCGTLGPGMEQQLNGKGFTLGHFPDSFVYSTVGGWVATRSAGMQSDKYGKIEDMVLSLRMVTPSGTIVTRTVPKSSNGIDVNHLCIGSEGILGVITEVTLQVHRLPERREIYGFLFPDFESGIKAIRECVARECMPMMVRFNDHEKTALSAAFKSKPTPLEALVSKAVKAYLVRVKGFDLSKSCIMLSGFEGDAKTFRYTRRKVTGIYKQHGAFSLGAGVGKTFEKSKYDFPHLRDYLMDRRIMADVSETSTLWSNILPLYHAAMDAIAQATRDTGQKAFVSCHISHNYHSGASLYFTFGCVQLPGRELEQYLYIKKAAEDAFMKNGGTLSHHHAVGTEHLPWIEEDISPAGVKAVQALKDGLDPNAIMNPGKIVPSPKAPYDWGLGEEAIARFAGHRQEDERPAKSTA